MSNIEKIRQEIERRKKRWMYDDLPIAMGRYYEDRDLLAFIDSLPEDDLPKTKGWVARNKDESLVFCYHKPHRENSITQEWWGSCDADFRIYDDTIDKQFKDLKWEDEPREVELIIKCRTCKESLQVQETCKENQDSFTDESKDLEEEIKNYFKGLWPGTETAEQCNTDLHFTPLAIMRLASHFAEWGAKH